MKQVLGYFLGFAIFIAGIPFLMWVVSGRPAWPDIPVTRLCISAFVAIAGLSLSVWTKRLMTDGPYRFSRNPMLSGTYLYYFGVVLALWNWRALLVFAVVAGLMMLQVRSEEKRLEADFGEEYLEYKKRTGRFITL